MNLVVGSGDTTALLSGKKTKGFAKLLQKFVADGKPYYNAFASPINQLRTGAILETNYAKILPEDYYCQYKATAADPYDCLTSSIDFAQIKKGKIVDFDELKTMFLTEYLENIVPLTDQSEEYQLEYIKKKFKNNYNQVQFQLLCSGLKSANLVFLSVETYDDEENMKREIKDKDFIKFRIPIDEEVILKVMERGTIFQSIKNAIQ